MFLLPLILEKQTLPKIAEELGGVDHGLLGCALREPVFVTYSILSWGTIAIALNAL